jgi:thiamine biosynthesis protein ThiS
MNILINGEKFRVHENINLINILKDNNLNTKNIVIEINKVIITRDHWENMKINENDSIEIITAVGGG